MYATDSCEHGPGFYYLESIDWSGANEKITEICGRLGDPFRAHNVYARPILRFLKHFGMTFKISCGIWAVGDHASVDLHFPQNLIDSKEYARIVGLWSNVAEHEALCMPGNRRWAEHLRATAPRLTKVFFTADTNFGGEGVVQKEFLKTSAPHHMHWSAYISAYELLKQMYQLYEMDLAKVIQIKKDDILVETHNYSILPFKTTATRQIGFPTTSRASSCATSTRTPTAPMSSTTRPRPVLPRRVAATTTSIRTITRLRPSSAACSNWLRSTQSVSST